MKISKLFRAILVIAIATIAGCSDGKPNGIPEATATAAQVVADTTGHYFGKDVAITGQVLSVNGGTVTLAADGGPGIECYMKGEGRAPIGQTVTIRGKCLHGDRGPTISNGFLVGE